MVQKPKTTVRVFDKGEYYHVYGEDADLAASEIFNNEAMLKTFGTGQYH